MRKPGKKHLKWLRNTTTVPDDVLGAPVRGGGYKFVWIDASKVVEALVYGPEEVWVYVRGWSAPSWTIVWSPR